jgi:hypothetical protein
MHDQLISYGCVHVVVFLTFPLLLLLLFLSHKHSLKELRFFGLSGFGTDHLELSFVVDLKVHSFDVLELDPGGFMIVDFLKI